jgi:1-deoxy-D-xylulose-5-phosphate reductoisomerase
MAYPERIEDGTLRTFDPLSASPLIFEEVDAETFALFALGQRAGREGGASPAVYNAANEVAVEAFLKEHVRFPAMADVVSHALDVLGGEGAGTLDQVLKVDAEAREVAEAAVVALKQRESSTIS